jgi:protein-S-isoprenylcysteine O-methyltransferase Ste14
MLIGYRMETIIVFVIGTLLIIFFSWWFSIKEKRYHGIYRFFSFESILALVLFNYPYWFEDPFSVEQIISWIFLFISIILAVDGFYLLKKIGKPKGQIENTSNLVLEGAYKYIRHPLYCSLLLLGCGAFLKYISTETILFVVVNTIALYETAKAEEKEMINKFGDEYLKYMKRTKMFIPFVY